MSPRIVCGRRWTGTCMGELHAVLRGYGDATERANPASVLHSPYKLFRCRIPLDGVEVDVARDWRKMGKFGYSECRWQFDVGDRKREIMRGCCIGVTTSSQAWFGLIQ